ncbi:hypothetical protein HDV05_005832 [Chytridiales sp. JEL 0842]|nr:hypothetical protein HDV05_005832 [Chytridiales sp. JEL 0842]
MLLYTTATSPTPSAMPPASSTVESNLPEHQTTEAADSIDAFSRSVDQATQQMQTILNDITDPNKAMTDDEIHQYMLASLPIDELERYTDALRQPANPQPEEDLVRLAFTSGWDFCIRFCQSRSNGTRFVDDNGNLLFDIMDLFGSAAFFEHCLTRFRDAFGDEYLLGPSSITRDIWRKRTISTKPGVYAFFGFPKDTNAPSQTYGGRSMRVSTRVGRHEGLIYSPNPAYSSESHARFYKPLRDLIANGGDVHIGTVIDFEESEAETWIESLHLSCSVEAFLKALTYIFEGLYIAITNSFEPREETWPTLPISYVRYQQRQHAELRSKSGLTALEEKSGWKGGPGWALNRTAGLELAGLFSETPKEIYKSNLADSLDQGYLTNSRLAAHKDNKFSSTALFLGYSFVFCNEAIEGDVLVNITLYSNADENPHKLIPNAMNHEAAAHVSLTTKSRPTSASPWRDHGPYLASISQKARNKINLLAQDAIMFAVELGHAIKVDGIRFTEQTQSEQEALLSELGMVKTVDPTLKSIQFKSRNTVIYRCVVPQALYSVVRGPLGKVRTGLEVYPEGTHNEHPLSVRAIPGLHYTAHAALWFQHESSPNRFYFCLDSRIHDARAEINAAQLLEWVGRRMTLTVRERLQNDVDLIAIHHCIVGYYVTAPQDARPGKSPRVELPLIKKYVTVTVPSELTGKLGVFVSSTDLSTEGGADTVSLRPSQPPDSHHVKKS